MLLNILAPAAIIGALGLLFGILLAVASKLFAVKGDPKVTQVRQALPGANCGACGYPGCDGFAEAIVKGVAQINGCPVCSSEQVHELGNIMGVEASDVEPLTAIVRCQGRITTTKRRYQYEGIEDCAAASQLADGYKECKYACMGMGNCVRVCPTDAITIEDGLAVINKDRCITCGKCAAICPRGIIGLLPKSSPVIVRCMAHDMGAHVRNACQTGCIACGLCVKSCPQEAIVMEDKLPVIDYDKCTGCGICANKCPRKSITLEINSPNTAFIDESNCVGCTLCKRACNFDAIIGEVKNAHVVDPDKCTGCGACLATCKKKAIHIIAKK